MIGLRTLDATLSDSGQTNSLEAGIAPNEPSASHLGRDRHTPYPEHGSAAGLFHAGPFRAPAPCDQGGGAGPMAHREA